MRSAMLCMIAICICHAPRMHADLRPIGLRKKKNLHPSPLTSTVEAVDTVQTVSLCEENRDGEKESSVC